MWVSDNRRRFVSFFFFHLVSADTDELMHVGRFAGLFPHDYIQLLTFNQYAN